MTAEPIQLIRARVPRSPDCGAHTRRLIAQALGDRLEPGTLDDAKLVASELVNNAYQHGRGGIELRVWARGRRLRIEVVDEGHGQAVKIREEPTDDGGRGLRIVEMLSAGWGAREGTTHVWADLDI